MTNAPIFNPLHHIQSATGAFAILLLLAFVSWRIFLAYLIMNDADLLFKRNRLFLNSNTLWIISTLAFGVGAVLVYWLLHYSILLHRTSHSDVSPSSES